jgi:hypothetical protein
MGSFASTWHICSTFLHPCALAPASSRYPQAVRYSHFCIRSHKAPPHPLTYTQGRAGQGRDGEAGETREHTPPPRAQMPRACMTLRADPQQSPRKPAMHRTVPPHWGPVMLTLWLTRVAMSTSLK